MAVIRPLLLSFHSSTPPNKSPARFGGLASALISVYGEITGQRSRRSSCSLVGGWLGRLCSVSEVWTNVAAKLAW